ncbi:MAG: hypothetical protein J6T77_02630, partial [Clostridia bacterium]|nr:hypothetical protein [Clostridia bacterium]
MEHTNHFNLNQPEKTDYVDIDKISDNFGTIDQPLYDGQTASEIVDSMVNPEYTGSRPNIYGSQTSFGDVGIDRSLNMRAGSDLAINNLATFTDNHITTADSGALMVRDSNNHVRPSDTSLADVKKAIDGNFLQKTVETTALRVLSGTTAAEGDILVRTPQNYVQSSGYTIRDIEDRLDCVRLRLPTPATDLIVGAPAAIYPASGTAGYFTVQDTSVYIGTVASEVSEGFVDVITHGIAYVRVYSSGGTTVNAGNILYPRTVVNQPTYSAGNYQSKYPAIIACETKEITA